MTLDTDLMTAVLIALIFLGVAGFPITKAFDQWRARVSAREIFGETRRVDKGKDDE